MQALGGRLLLQTATGSGLEARNQQQLGYILADYPAQALTISWQVRHLSSPSSAFQWYSSDYPACHALMIKVIASAAFILQHLLVKTARWAGLNASQQGYISRCDVIVFEPPAAVVAAHKMQESGHA